MKKVIVVLLVVAVLAGAGLIGWNVYEKEVLLSPENQILGHWESENGMLSYVFREDGTMSGNIDAILGTVSINGTYSLDEENNQVTLTYTLYSISYTDVKSFVIENDTLKLTDTKTNISVTYYRPVQESATQTEVA